MDHTNDGRKRSVVHLLIGLSLACLLALGCEPNEEGPRPARPLPSAPAGAADIVKDPAAAVAEQVCYRMATGDFHEAGMLLAAPDTPQGGILKPLLSISYHCLYSMPPDMLE